MKTHHLLMALLAIPTLSLAATPVSANCDNYGNQVNVGSNDTCTVNEQYCNQQSGAGGGAGAGGPSGSNGASATAGSTTTCTQNPPPKPPGGGGGACDVTNAFALTQNLASFAQVSGDPTAAPSVAYSGILALTAC